MKYINCLYFHTCQAKLRGTFRPFWLSSALSSLLHSLWAVDLENSETSCCKFTHKRADYYKMGWVEDPTLLFTERDSLLIHNTGHFCNYCCFKTLLLSLKGSISHNHMDTITSASVQLCSTQQMHHPFRHSWCFCFFLCRCFMTLPLHHSWKPFYTPATTSRQRLKGSHYQHVNTMSPFPPHSSITNNRLWTGVAARQQKENTWDILSAA